MNSLQKLFHKHTLIHTSRTLIGTGSRDCTTGPNIDWQPTNIYLEEGYCLHCDMKFKSKTSVLQIFDRPQPYDKGQA